MSVTNSAALRAVIYGNGYSIAVGESSQDLSQSNWTNVVPVTNTGEETLVFDPSPMAQQRFYRAVST